VRLLVGEESFHASQVADIPVPLMLGEAVHLINKLPTLRFLFFFLVHGTTPGGFGISFVEGGGY